MAVYYAAYSGYIKAITAKPNKVYDITLTNDVRTTIIPNLTVVNVAPQQRVTAGQLIGSNVVATNTNTNSDIVLAPTRGYVTYVEKTVQGWLVRYKGLDGREYTYTTLDEIYVTTCQLIEEGTTIGIRKTQQYIWNQYEKQQPTSNFWISGKARIDGSLIVGSDNTKVVATFNGRAVGQPAIEQNEYVVLSQLPTFDALQFNNGLTKTDAVVQLGGSLIKNTNIFFDSHTLQLDATGGVLRIPGLTSNSNATRVLMIGSNNHLHANTLTIPPEIKEPLYQVLTGTGTGVTSNANMKFNGQLLEVLGDIKTNYIGFPDSGGYTTGISASMDSTLKFFTAGQATMQLKSNGQAQLTEYGQNIFTGTVSRLLAVDANGNLIEAAPYEILPDTDNQTLSINGNQLSILRGNTITLPDADNQTLSLAGNVLSISNGNQVTLPDRDQQTLVLAGQLLSISGGNTVTLPVQTLALVGNILSISNGNQVTLPDRDQQTLSITGNQLTISNGNTITLPDADNQTLTLVGRVLSISGGNSVTLPEGTVDTDQQTLSITGNQLTISNGNTVTIPVTVVSQPLNQVVYGTGSGIASSPKMQFDATNNQLTVMQTFRVAKVADAGDYFFFEPNATSGWQMGAYAGNGWRDLYIDGTAIILGGRGSNATVRIAGLAGGGSRGIGVNNNGDIIPFSDGGTGGTDTDQQTLSIVGNQLSISNGNTVTIPDSDQQTLSLLGNVLSISGGNSVTLPSGTADTDQQTLAISGHTLSITNGNSVTIPDNQTLSISGNVLSIARGNSITLPDSDNQVLGISGNTLTISSGNSVTLPIVSRPNTQIVYGTGTGISSSADMLYANGQFLLGYAAGNGLQFKAMINGDLRVNNIHASYIGFTDPNGFTTGIGSLNNWELDFITGGTSKMVLKNSGQLQLLHYGDNLFTGTPSRYLAVDVNGFLIEVPIPTTGGGTVDTDQQTLSINGNQLTISNGNTITLPDRDQQTLSLSGQQLTISNGNTITLPDRDQQTLSISGNTLSISNGNSVELPVSTGGGGSKWTDVGSDIYRLSKVSIGTNEAAGLSRFRVEALVNGDNMAAVFNNHTTASMNSTVIGGVGTSTVTISSNAFQLQQLSLAGLKGDLIMNNSGAITFFYNAHNNAGVVGNVHIMGTGNMNGYAVAGVSGTVTLSGGSASTYINRLASVVASRPQRAAFGDNFTGSVGDYYGVYIDDAKQQDTAGFFYNMWGMYQAGLNVPNRMEGTTQLFGGLQGIIRDIYGQTTLTVNDFTVRCNVGGYTVYVNPTLGKMVYNIVNYSSSPIVVRAVSGQIDQYVSITLNAYGRVIMHSDSNNFLILCNCNATTGGGEDPPPEEFPV